MNKRRDYEETRSQIFGGLDDLFFAQEVRVRGALNPRPKERRTVFGDTSLVINNPLAQDDFDVENK